ncbi:hypothetical protein GCM10009799_02820 [Nocardiopsis rhodophaea]|uniref:DUF6879 domain-containing protein n=1 Tax=Nocardiopsis rhodophaea TaxID=280238 RepID=A0ABN2S6A6_9ACTN
MTAAQGQRGRPVSEEEFDRFFTDFLHTAFRLETLQKYDMTYEEEHFRRFLQGKDLGPSSALDAWGHSLRQKVREGRKHSRVHVVVEPLTDYVRFECVWAYQPNVAAGEDIRILPVKEGEWPQGIPCLDYWLFDSHHLVLMRYTPEGAMLPPELVDDSEQIVAANVWRDRAMHMSIPFVEYAKRFDAAMRSQ